MRPGGGVDSANPHGSCGFNNQRDFFVRFAARFCLALFSGAFFVCFFESLVLAIVFCGWGSELIRTEGSERIGIGQ